MNFYRQFTWLVLVTLILAFVGAGSGAVVRAQTPIRQGAQTPDEICAAADTTEPESRTFEEAEQVLQEGVDYWAVLCTEAGAIYADLFEDEAPITVNSFVFLAQQGYFNHLTFHRVLPGFMAQGGDPEGTGGGGPGYEFVNETSPDLLFDRAGRLAMANAGPDTNGSQFFITYGPTPHLDGGYTIFGQVVEGQDAAELLRPRDPDRIPDYTGSVLDTVVIVEDPSTVTVTPDEPPTVEHLQAMLDLIIAGQLSGDIFGVVEDFSHTYDLQQEAESWQEEGGDELVAYLTDYLAEKGFIGTAAVMLMVNECPANPDENPVWAVAFQVSDYGGPDAGASVALDNERSDMLVSSGVFESYEDDSLLGGRIYQTAAEGEWCGDNDVYYRYELPAGRYVLTLDAVLDGAVVNDPAMAHDFLLQVMDGLLLGQIGGTLERGNAATVAAE